jgi:hypothetical protein
MGEWQQIESITIKEFRCNNCEGMTPGKPAAYVNNSGWCKGCVRRLKHWWAWLIPPVPNAPLNFLVCFYMLTGYGAAIGFGLYMLLGTRP